MWWQLFYSFFKIGLFGFGGGYAMLSMIQGEVVTRHAWLTPQEFTDIIAISQMTPGPIGINSATYIGYTATGSIWGAALATFALVLPSFIVMLILYKFFMRYHDSRPVTDTFAGLRPAVIGLIASAALVLMNTENFGSPGEDFRQFLFSLGIFAAVLTANFFFQSQRHTSNYTGRHRRIPNLLNHELRRNAAISLPATSRFPASGTIGL